MKKIFVFILFWIFISQVFGQLPEPKDFCSHAQYSKTNKRAKQIDYQQYDAYDVLFYHLHLEAESNSLFLKGEVKIKAQSLNNSIDTLVLELSNGFSLSGVKVNNLDQSFLHQNDAIFIVLDSELAANKEFEVLIAYEGNAQSENGRGYNLVENYHGTSLTWTLSEPFYSKDWWPCKQDLLDKADSVWVDVTTARENKVGSNGLLVHTEELENNKIRYEWKSKYPIAYYLISIAVAGYMEYSFVIENEEGNHVFVQNYLYPDSVLYRSQKALIDCTYYQMNLLQEKYGVYPFIDEKYGHCITPMSGGMEHQTMTTQRDFGFHLTIHEMGHSWFGNQVTCARWNDIWINEGFATYTQYLGMQYLLSEASADAFMAGMQSVVMREPDGSVYVPDEYLDDRSRIFSGRLSYYKGAVIIQMIRYLVGEDDLFFSILREFQGRFKNSTATAEDFRIVLEELSGQDFEAFFDLWYYGEGFPIYDFQWQQNVSNTLKIDSRQQSSTEKTAFFPMKFDVMIFYEDGSQEKIELTQNQQNQQFEFDVKQRIKNILPNPRNQNLMQIQSIKQGILQPNEVKIEPNPLKDKCLIRFGNYQPDRILQLYNSAQKLIFEQEAPQLNHVLDFQHYASGVYFLYVNVGNQSEMYKLIKI